MRALSGFFVVLGLLLAPIGVAGVWTQRTLLPSDQFADLAVDVLHQQTVADALAVRLTDEVEAHADLPNQARSIVQTAVTRAINTAEFEAIFRATVGGMHEQLIRGDEELALSFDDALPIIKETATRIDPSVAAQIPAAGLPVVTVVRESDAPALWKVVNVVRRSSLVFPIAVGILLALGIALAPRRGRTMILVGIGLLVVAIVLVLLIDLGRDVLSQVAGPEVEVAAFDAGYDVVASSFAGQTALLGALGVVIGVGGGALIWRQRRNWRSEEWA